MGSKPPLRPGTYLLVSLDQKAFPETPLGSIPDGAHLSAIEKQFLEFLGKWCNDGGYCPLEDVELAKDLNWRCLTDRAKRSRVQCILNGRNVRGVFRPGLAHPSRGFVTVEFNGIRRNGRRIRTTWKWRELMERHRVTPGAANNGHAQVEAQTVTVAPIVDELAALIAKAAFIAETHIHPPEAGQALAQQIRDGADGFAHPGRLADAVWMAADPKRNGKVGDFYTWLQGCDRKGGVDHTAAMSARRRVLKRDNPVAKVVDTKVTEPVPPPSSEDIAMWTERLREPAFRPAAQAFFRLANLPIPQPDNGLSPPCT